MFIRNYVIKLLQAVAEPKEILNYKDIVALDNKIILMKSFITEFMVSCIAPEDVREFVKVYCMNCHNL